MSAERFAEYRSFRLALQRSVAHMSRVCDRFSTNNNVELEIRLAYSERACKPVKRSETSRERLVSVGKHSFDSEVEPWLFLALFQQLSERKDAVVGQPVVDWVQRADTVRIIHCSSGRCRREDKTRIQAPEDFVLVGVDSAASPCMVRIGMANERLLHANACGNECSFAKNRDGLTERERRSIVLLDGRDLWRFDFTRINGQQKHQVELELNGQRALEHARHIASEKNVDCNQLLTHIVAERLITLLDELEHTILSLRKQHTQRVYDYCKMQ